MKAWFEFRQSCDLALKIKPRVPLSKEDMTNMLNLIVNTGYVVYLPYPEYGELLIHSTVAVANSHMSAELVGKTRELLRGFVNETKNLIHTSGEGERLQ